MTVVMSKFPHINQFRNVIREVTDSTRYVGKDENGGAIFDPNIRLPVLKFFGTTKIHGCVSADTLVTLADGDKIKIEDIKNGTSILSYNEKTNSIEYDVVNEVVIQELDKEWVELVFDNGSVLKCTADHPILTTDGWVNAENLEETHILILES